MVDFNIDLAVKYVKTIIDSTQCFTCDKLTGPCVRFPCGHSVCESCAVRTSECLFCSSSPIGTNYLMDKPKTKRVSNASALLTTFQDEFKIDVCKRQQISDHLKLERSVFPDCIQAPSKYCNKRKSSNVSNSNKENINLTLFSEPRIFTSDKVKMKKSFQYVQKWLDEQDNIQKTVLRKPFEDINANTPLLAYKNKRNVAKYNKIKTQKSSKISTYGKKSNFKSLNRTSSFLNDIVTPHLKSNNLKIETSKDTEKFKDVHKRSDKNESGIVIDDDTILIEDTEMEIIDKDHLAYLAVLEAAEKEEYENKNVKALSQSILQNKDANDSVDLIENEVVLDNNEIVSKTEDVLSSVLKRVLFYKKSSLIETCKLCNFYINSHNNSSCTGSKNDVSIVINNSSFMTTIKFMNATENKYKGSDKHSVAIQTDKNISLSENEIAIDAKNIRQQKRKIVQDDDIIPDKKTKSDVDFESLDLFNTNKTNKDAVQVENINCKDIMKQNVENDPLRHSKCLIIEDSDTDSNGSCDNSFIHEVVAEVHSTNATDMVQRGILTNLAQINPQQRSVPPLRGDTPHSSDSSDKENLDPNRKKSFKVGKKLKSKKCKQNRV